MPDLTSDFATVQRLLTHAAPENQGVILASACAAGIIWQCVISACTQHNPRGEELCSGCGHDAAGNRVSDVQPGLYDAPAELWEHLRSEIAEKLRFDGLSPMPDAVTFPYVSTEDGHPWSGHRLVLHYGGDKRPYETSLTATDVPGLLDDIDEAVEPGYAEALRIVLPH